MMRAVLAVGCTAALALAGCTGTLKPTPTTPAELSRIAGWKGAAPNSADSFRFIILGDRTGGHAEGAWEKAIAEVNRLKPDFVLCVGDLIEGYKEDADLIHAQWKELDTLTRQLDAPFFYCAGNHDIKGNIPRTTYIALHGVNGRSYYSFDYRSCHFVILDSDAIVDNHAAVVPAQWAWLEKDLAASRDAKHVFVIYHHPIYDQPQWQKMRAMLDPARTTVFTGHRHELSYDVEDEIPYFVLSSTATKSANDRPAGKFSSYAHVVVNGGRPTVSIIPVGEILPHNFIDRHMNDVMAAMTTAANLTGTTPAGGEVTLELAGPEDGQAAVTVTWTGEADWFSGGLPKTETISLPPKEKIARTYRVNESQPNQAVPAVSLDYSLQAAGGPLRRTVKLPLPVIAMWNVPRAGSIKIDNSLADWAGVGARTTATRDRVTYHPEAWTGPADCSLATRLAYDDKTLYIAVEVTDDTLVTDNPNAWENDSLELFWDPRPAGARSPAFEESCRQLVIAAPKESNRPTLTILPAGSIDPSRIEWSWAPRAGGYAVELAIPFSQIAEGFTARPGQTLYFEAMANDKDPGDAKGVVSNVVLSGDDNASRRTVGYARLTFVGK